MMRFFKDAEYRYELLLRYNHYIDLNPWPFMAMIFSPYILCSVAMIIFSNHKLTILPFYGLATVVLLVAMLLRQQSISFQFFDDDKKGRIKKRVFSNKWLQRGRTQYVYILPIDDYKTKMFVFNTRQSHYAQYFPGDIDKICTYDSHWGDWDLSSTIPASQEDIDRYGLNEAEAKILLIQNDR